MKIDEAKAKVAEAARVLNRAIADATLAGYGVTLTRATRPMIADLAAVPQVVVDVTADWQEKAKA